MLFNNYFTSIVNIDATLCGTAVQLDTLQGVEHVAVHALQGVVHLLDACGLLFFIVKGMSMVLHAGILYTASGLLFPLPLAVLVNILGTVCMVTAPWLYGRFIGGDIAERFDKKYPAAARVASFREKNDWLFSLGVRLLSGLPSDPLSMYLGAVRLPWPALIFGAVLAYLPNAVTMPVMAQHAAAPGSPVFVVSAAVAVLFACAPAIFLLVLLIRNRRARRRKKEEEEDVR